MNDNWIATMPEIIKQLYVCVLSIEQFVEQMKQRFIFPMQCNIPMDKRKLFHWLLLMAIPNVIIPLDVSGFHKFLQLSLPHCIFSNAADGIVYANNLLRIETEIFFVCHNILICLI